MNKRQFIVYRRRSGKKRMSYYAAFLNPETGDYNRRRVLRTKIGYPITREADALEAARILYETGDATKSKEEIGAYLAAFWALDGDYVTGRRKQGRALAVAYIEDMLRCVKLYALPWLKEQNIEKLAVDHWTPGHAEDLMKAMDKKGLSPGRVNNVRKAITTALSIYWKRKGQRERNPMLSVEKYHEEQPKREIFSSVEVHKFFAQKMEPRLWAINALAATGGLRLGECLGLSPEAVTREEVRIGKRKLAVYQVEIRPKGNWQPKEGAKDPKWKSTGKVVIPAGVGQAIEKVIAANRWQNSFVFYGASNSAPLAKRTVEKEFAKTCNAIGIPEKERLRRLLTFHAWRHWYEAQYRGKIDDHVLREQMRHKSLKMTERYSHVTEDQARLVKKIAAGMF